MEPSTWLTRQLPDGSEDELSTLREAAERLRALNEVTTEGILIHERGTVLDVNPAFLRLVQCEKREDLVGRNGLDVVPFTPESRARVLEHIRSGSTETYDVEIVRPDGSTARMETGGRTTTYLGRPVRLVFLRDVSDKRRSEEERQRLEASLQQAQKMESIGRLAGGVAHDFNNLLTAIGGYAGLARAAVGVNHGAAAYLDEVLKAVDLAALLTQQLLTFSRKQIINPKVINLNECVGRVKKMLERLVNDNIELTTTLAPNLASVRMDPGQIEQIIVNLATNAQDAMPSGGKLAIETANVVLDESFTAKHVGVAPGPHVMLSVSDSGTGMDAETLKHVFEPFFTTKPRGQGTGLGLAIVYGAVQQNRGCVEVCSTLGRGSCVKVYLPQVDAVPDVTAPSERPMLLGGTETIVLVEDAELVRSFAASVLRQHGYRVHEFASGDAALSAVREMTEPVHLLITDVILPGINGCVLAERLLELEPQLRVLYASGYAEDVIVRQGVPKQGIELITKPYAVEGLLERVRKVLDRKP